MTSEVGRDPAIQYHHTLFLSDLHLGAIGSRADLILNFLRQNVAETYMLAGDILDIEYPFVPHWTPTQQAVIDHLNAARASGARMVYVRGNHDPEPDRAPNGKRLPVPAVNRAVHIGADGRRFLVVHGDEQDQGIFKGPMFTRIGSRIDHILRSIDRRVRIRLHDPEPGRRSVIEYLLAHINRGMYPRRTYEQRLVELARADGFDGVICGHFHRADLHDRHGLIYANCGDWIDSFTALAADHQGRFHVLGGRQAFSRTKRTGYPPELIYT